MKSSGFIGAFWRTFVASESQRLRRGERLIVCTYLEEWQYFVSEPHLWLLDRSDSPHSEHQGKRFEAAAAGDEDGRTLLAQMEPYRRSIDDLRELLVANFDTSAPWSESVVLFPALMIDFRRKLLLSVWPESPPFEEHVPAGWTGEVREFMDAIPIELRYWIVDGDDYWAKLRPTLPGA